MRNCPTTIIILSLLAILLVTGCSLTDRLGEGDPESDKGDAQGGAETGTLIIESVTLPAGQAGTFQYTGVPTGTLSSGGTLVVSDLPPGTYTTTEINPAPDFDVTAVECDDGSSQSTSGGDPQTRTAVFNLDPGETITCTFTNSRRGSVVVAGQIEPDGTAGSFQFTGVPTGTIPANGTLVVANLVPGTYSTTEKDPAPDFDLTAVECDDAASPSASSGDPQTRTAIFNVDPGEMVTCTFTNTRRGTVVVSTETVPTGTGGTFQFTGVPSGTVSGSGTLVAANLTPGTYTTTEVDPGPEFELTAVECDDAGSPSASSGDAQTRTGIFNLDAGEMITCNFINEAASVVLSPTVTTGGGETGGSSAGNPPAENSAEPAGDTNPFENPGQYLENFPLPAETPPGAGTYSAPKPGPWSVTNFAGQMDCGGFSLAIPASPPESGVLEVLDDGQTLIGAGLQDAQGVSITLNADPDINGRYAGAIQGMEQGVPVTINYFWQVVTDEYIVGFLTAGVTAEGVDCSIYRSFEMIFTG